MTEEETKAKGVSFLRKRSKGAARAALLACSLCLGSVGLGCGAGDAGPTDEGSSSTPAPALAAAAAPAPLIDTATGSISLGLDVGNAHLDSVNYTVIGGSFHQSGTLDVSDSTRVSGVIGGIPFGTGYVVTLSATGSVPVSVACQGSATFQVPDQVLVQVPVHITCAEQKIVAATPAPIPPAAVALLALALLGAGLAVQRRASFSAQNLPS